MLVNLPEQTNDAVSDLVIPSLERNPQRVYRQTGATVRCYRITSDVCVFDNRKITTSGEYLFEIVLNSKEQADALMRDLYYGEYNGG